MATDITIYGVVIPERVDVNLKPIVLPYSVLGNSISILIEIIRSKIFCRITSGTTMNISDIKNVTQSVVYSIVNYVGFLKNYGYNVQLDHAINNATGENIVFGIDGYAFSKEDSIQEGVLFRPNLQNESSIDIGMLADGSFCRAIQEIRNSIAYPDYTALHCKLAIDAIQSAFAGDDKARWSKLRENLKIDKATLKSFNQAADEQRHGKNIPQTWEERRWAIQVASEVVHRYLLWRQNESLPIAATIFDFVPLKFP